MSSTKKNDAVAERDAADRQQEVLKSKYSPGQLAYLRCTIYQQVENGKVVTENPQGKFFFLKTPISGPGIDDAPLPDGVAEGVEAVPEGAKCWWRQYSEGTLLNGFGYSFGDPQLPTDEASHQFRILGEFEKNPDGPVEKNAPEPRVGSLGTAGEGSEGQRAEQPGDAPEGRTL